MQHDNTKLPFREVVRVIAHEWRESYKAGGITSDATELLEEIEAALCDDHEYSAKQPKGATQMPEPMACPHCGCKPWLGEKHTCHIAALGTEQAQGDVKPLMTEANWKDIVGAVEIAMKQWPNDPSSVAFVALEDDYDWSEIYPDV